MNLTPVVINGVPIEMLIDSGACVNVLDNASFNKRRSHHEPDHAIAFIILSACILIFLIFKRPYYATPNVTKYQVPFLNDQVMRCLHQAWRVLRQVACVFHQAVCYLHQLFRVCCHLLCFTH